MENATPGISIPPVATQGITTGSDKKIMLPVKLWILLKRWFNNKYKPITPIMNIMLSTIKIALTDIYPTLKRREVKSGMNGGR